MIFLKKKEIIILKENILHSEILLQEIFLHEAAKEVCDEGRGVKGGEAVYLDFKDAINRLGQKVIEERYGNFLKCMKLLQVKIHIKFR